MLKASGMNMTPEVYQAYALVKSGAVLLGAIPCMFLFPLLVPVVVVLALLLYFKENQKADETLKAKREEIRRGTSENGGDYGTGTESKP